MEMSGRDSAYLCNLLPLVFVILLFQSGNLQFKSTTSTIYSFSDMRASKSASTGAAFSDLM